MLHDLLMWKSGFKFSSGMMVELASLNMKAFKKASTSSSYNLIFIGLLALVISCFIGLCCAYYTPLSPSPTTERFLDSNSSDRRLIYDNSPPTRNELIMPLISKLLVDGTLDTVVQKTAITEMLNRVSFYPYQYNYDMFCDAVNEETLTERMANKHRQICSVYDLNSLAIEDQGATNAITNPNYKNSLILIDNNFYNIYSKTGVFFSVISVDLVGNVRPELQRLVRLRIKSISEEFILLRPAFVFVPMMGLFRVVYDFNQIDNVMNFYDSEMTKRTSYLYFEPVNTQSVASKPILPTVTFIEQATGLLKSQFNYAKCTFFYLLPNNTFPHVSSIDQACVATFDLKIGTISQFDVGNAQSPETKYIPSINILLSDQDGLQVLCKGSSIIQTFNKERVRTILENFQVRKLIVTCAFNTVTVSVFYMNPMDNTTGICIFREVPSDVSLKDRLFSLQTNILDIDQMKVSYSLPELVNVAKNNNINISKV